MDKQIYLVNSAHGVYAFQVLVTSALKHLDQEFLPRWSCTPEHKAQILESLKAGPDNEYYWDCANDIEQYLVYVYRGDTYHLTSNEGDIWLIEESALEELI